DKGIDQPGDFNLTGWMSSYTGDAIPPDEMRIWVEETVARVQALRPSRVLEIGCGTGLLLTRLAGNCTAYTGTDFSASALAQLRRYLKTRDDLAHVDLKHGLAHDLAFVPEASVDVVVLNSIVQYFPDIDYLVDVLAEAMRVARDGGHIFIGDVRSLPLLEAFHTSVALHRAEDGLSVADLRSRVAHALRQEKELAIDPALFDRLADQWPRLARAEVSLKSGTYDNELSRFRYDVVLTLGPHQRVAEPDEWISWDAGGEWRAAVDAALRSGN